MSLSIITSAGRLYLVSSSNARSGKPLSETSPINVFLLVVHSMPLWYLCNC